MKSSYLSQGFKLLQYVALVYLGNLAFGLVQQKLRTVKLEKLIKKKASDRVDLSSEDSFPASDPPSWGGGGTIAATNL